MTQVILNLFISILSITYFIYFQAYFDDSKLFVFGFYLGLFGTFFVDMKLTIWARSDFINALTNVSQKVLDSLEVLEDFWKIPYPLPKLDVFALPNYQATRPADSWGVLLFK